MSRPLLVAEDDTAYTAIANELLGAGWQIAAAAQHDGDVVVSLTVHESADAQTAVLTALDGVGLLIRAKATARVVDDLVDDLRRIGHVVIADAATSVVLDVETWRLLHALGQGATLAVAARALHMSTRTANRRITVARAALNTPTRAQLQRALTAPTRVAPAPSLTSRWRPAIG